MLTPVLPPVLRRVPRWLVVVALAAVPLAGCGNDGTPARSATPASLSPAQTLNSPLPTGWPDAVHLPDGTNVTDSNGYNGDLTVTFESQEFADSLAKFLDAQLAGAGFDKGATTERGDTETTTYTSGMTSATVTLVETGGTTTGTVVIAQAPTAAPATPTASTG